MLWSEYQGIDQLVFKRAFIWTYEYVVAQTDDRFTETIIFDRGVHKFIIVTAIRISEQVYVTDYNCN